MAFWSGLFIGCVASYLWLTLKMWDCILQSWKARDIRMRLEGDADLIGNHHYRMGWLMGHQDIVRQLDMSPWNWWFRKRWIVAEVTKEEPNEQ